LSSFSGVLSFENNRTEYSYSMQCVLVFVTVPGPVTSLNATERGSFHVKLEWTEPIHKNGIITNYVIEYVIG